MLLCSLILSEAAQNQTIYCTVAEESGALNVACQQEVPEAPSLIAHYGGDKEKIGFKDFQLRIIDKNLSNKAQMYAAGFAEGYLTAEEIKFYRANTYPELVMNKQDYPPMEFQQYVKDQKQYHFDQAVAHPDLSSEEGNFWASVQLGHDWLDGLAAGFSLATGEKVTGTDMYYLNAIMDFESLMELWVVEDPAAVVDKRTRTHCSGFVYPKPDLKDVFFSHVSWNWWYSSFNRITKSLNLNLKLLHTARQHIQYSSYPGLFFSLDDFYLIRNLAADGKENNGASSNMMVLETTFNNFNKSNLAKMVPTSVLTFMRTMLSTLNAYTPEQWTSFMSKEISLTYANNYLVLDYNKFDSTLHECNKCSVSELKEKLLSAQGILRTVEIADVEQTLAWDATNTLFTQNFYASVNSPVSDQVHNFYNYTSYPYYDYNGSARLAYAKKQLGDQIVQDYAGFKKFMRSNNYISDGEIQHHDPREGISSRYDLCGTHENIVGNCTQEDKSLAKSKAFSAVDTKVINMDLARNFTFEFLYGPTYGSDERGWFPRVSLVGVNHAGVPDEVPLFGPGEDTFYPITAVLCENRDPDCKRCTADYDEEAGVCVPIDYLPIILALAIPLGVLVVGLIIWSIFFFRKPKYEKITSA